MLHPELICFFVRLSAGCANGRAFFHIQGAELDSGGVDIFRHLAAQSVDLFHQLAFSQTTDGRVAGHLRDGVQIDGENERRVIHPRRCESRLTASVASADNDNIVFFVVEYHG